MDATHGNSSDQSGPVVWETTACPLCGVADETELLLAPGETAGEVYRLAQCCRCDMVYLNPRPDRASIGHYYADNYQPYQGPKRDRLGSPTGLRQRLQRLVNTQAFGDPPPLTRWSDKLLATLASPWLYPGRDSLTALPFHGEGRLLDFGCGSGWYAKRMSDRGWTVTAMDFNPRTAEQVAQRYGLRTLSGTLPHADIEDAGFDMVVMGALLEHVHCPHEVVGAAARALRPGGRFVAVVPNFAAVALRWFGVDWWPLDPPRRSAALHARHNAPPDGDARVGGRGTAGDTARQLDAPVAGQPPPATVAADRSPRPVGPEQDAAYRQSDDALDRLDRSRRRFAGNRAASGSGAAKGGGLM